MKISDSEQKRSDRMWSLAPLLVLFVRFSQPSLAARETVAVNGDPIQLCMQTNSASYRFTQSDETDQIAIDYLRVERNQNPALNRAWECASKCAPHSDVPSGLRTEHIVAVTAYTSKYFHADFNRLLRTYGANDSIYSKFPFKSVHYLLSVALEKLRWHSVRTTYRGMPSQAVGKKGSPMRFGQFASTSLDPKEADKFGGKTMFTITSRLGAHIEEYSCSPEEREVLVPPWEVFNITKYVEREGSVNITLRGVRRMDIPVKVERGEGGVMRVVRNGADPVSSADALRLLILLGNAAHASFA